MSSAILSVLPAVNAVLNGTSAVLLVTGWLLIRRRRIVGHRAAMLLAFLVSVVFLSSYLTLRYFAGFTRFTGQGWARSIYFAILISHTALAAMVPPLAITLLYLAFRSRFTAHRRLARWAFPIWLYVSVTGVIVYLMLYQLYPSP